VYSSFGTGYRVEAEHGVFGIDMSVPFCCVFWRFDLFGSVHITHLAMFDISVDLVSYELSALHVSVIGRNHGELGCFTPVRHGCDQSQRTQFG